MMQGPFPKQSFMTTALLVLVETNVTGIFSEALTANVEAILSNETSSVGANATRDKKY